MKRDTVIACVYGAVSVMVGGMLIWGPESRFTDSLVPSVELPSGGAPMGEAGREELGVANEGELEVGADGLLSARRTVRRGARDGGMGYRSGETWYGPRAVWTKPLGPRDRAEDPRGPYLGGLPVRASPLMEFGIPEVEEVATILREAGLAPPLMESSLREVYGHVQRLAFFEERAAADAEQLAELNRAAIEAGDGSRRVLPEEKLWLESWIPRRDAYIEYVRRDLEVRWGLGDAAVSERLMAVAGGMAFRARQAVVSDSGLPQGQGWPPETISP